MANLALTPQYQEEPPPPILRNDSHPSSDEGNAVSDAITNLRPLCSHAVACAHDTDSKRPTQALRSITDRVNRTERRALVVCLPYITFPARLITEQRSAKGDEYEEASTSERRLDEQPIVEALRVLCTCIERVSKSHIDELSSKTFLELVHVASVAMMRSNGDSDAEEARIWAVGLAGRVIPKAGPALKEEGNAAALGYVMSSLLGTSQVEADRGPEKGNKKLRSEAIYQVRSVISSVDCDADVLAFFLPGVASSLLKQSMRSMLTGCGGNGEKALVNALSGAQEIALATLLPCFGCPKTLTDSADGRGESCRSEGKDFRLSRTEEWRRENAQIFAGQSQKALETLVERTKSSRVIDALISLAWFVAIDLGDEIDSESMESAVASLASALGKKQSTSGTTPSGTVRMQDRLKQKGDECKAMDAMKKVMRKQLKSISDDAFHLTNANDEDRYNRIANRLSGVLMLTKTERAQAVMQEIDVWTSISILLRPKANVTIKPMFISQEQEGNEYAQEPKKSIEGGIEDGRGEVWPLVGAGGFETMKGDAELRGAKRVIASLSGPIVEAEGSNEEGPSTSLTQSLVRDALARLQRIRKGGFNTAQFDCWESEASSLVSAVSSVICQGGGSNANGSLQNVAKAFLFEVSSSKLLFADKAKRRSQRGTGQPSREHKDRESFGGSKEKEQIRLRLAADAVLSIGKVATGVGDAFETSPHLMPVYLPKLLNRLGDPNECISNSAARALQMVSGATASWSIGKLISRNMDYAIDTLTKQLRDLKSYPHAPNMFATILEKAERASEILPMLEEPLRIAEERLSVMDRNKHKHSFSRILYEMSKCANKESKQAASWLGDGGKDEMRRMEIASQTSARVMETAKHLICSRASEVAANALQALEMATATLRMCVDKDAAAEYGVSQSSKKQIEGRRYSRGWGLGQYSSSDAAEQSATEASEKPDMATRKEHMIAILPPIANVWEPLVGAARLHGKEDSLVLERCLSAMQQLLISTGDGGRFLQQRLSNDAIPLLEETLTYNAHPSHSTSHPTKLRSLALNFLTQISQHDASKNALTSADAMKLASRAAMLLGHRQTRKEATSCIRSLYRLEPDGVSSELVDVAMQAPSSSDPFLPLPPQPPMRADTEPASLGESGGESGEEAVASFAQLTELARKQEKKAIIARDGHMVGEHTKQCSVYAAKLLNVITSNQPAKPRWAQ